MISRLKRLALGLIAAVSLGSVALAQSNPGFSYGFVPTPGQWNSFFSAKQDYLGFIPLSLGGGVMQGPLTTVPSTSAQAGFTLPVGVAPSSPASGNMWATSAGFYGYINGVTYGPFSNAITVTVGTNPISGGTPGNILFDSASKVGEKGVSGSGNVCLVTSCVLITPTLGVALVTSINGNAVPSASDTVALLAATQTLSGKTLTSPVINNATMTAPALGTIASGNLGSATNVPVDQAKSGSILPAANGGAGTTTGALKANGSGAVSQAACADLSNDGPYCPALVGQLPGTATNDAASAGNIGELMSSTVNSPGSSVTSGTPGNLTSLSLTAGDWDVTCTVYFFPAASTSVIFGIANVSTTTGTLQLTPGAFGETPGSGTTLAGNSFSATGGPWRESLASTTTVYCVQDSSFSVSTMTAFGVMRARRVR